MESTITKSPEETAKVAEMMLTKVDFKKIKKPVVFLLRGELGGGKTVFAKSIGKALGVKETITSPTFIIFNSYKTNPKFEIRNSKQIRNPNFQNPKLNNIKKFLHIDLYRIEDGKELDEIGFFDLFDKDSLACVEWPENMGEKYLEKFRKMVYVIDVWFEYGEKEYERKIRVDLEK